MCIQQRQFTLIFSSFHSHFFHFQGAGARPPKYAPALLRDYRHRCSAVQHCKSTALLFYRQLPRLTPCTLSLSLSLYVYSDIGLVIRLHAVSRRTSSSSCLWTQLSACSAVDSPVIRRRGASTPCPRRKTVRNLHLSELRQMSINFDNCWHTDSTKDRFMWGAFIFHLT